MTRRAQLMIVGGVLFVLALGLILLATWDIPAPSEPVVKTLDNDRFPS